MIKDKCVLILGAGASAPYGFPTGPALKTIICSNFKSLWEKFVFDRSQTPLANDYLEEEKIKARKFVNDFRKFEHDSIDLFLTIHRDHSEIGKKAIFLNILNAEANSIQGGRTKNWYTTLFGLMISGITHPDNIEQFIDNNITIITFNYDRSLENYLYESFMNYNNIKRESEKIIILNKIKIHHVYGKLAGLPWENDTESLKFGQEIWANQLDEKKDNIKTIYERRSEDLEDMINSIHYADKIYFLGFGFAEENVRILKLHEKKRVDQIIYTSDFENRKVMIETQMRALGIWQENSTVVCNNSDCQRVIEDYLF